MKHFDSRVRFDLTERMVHWSTALLMLTCIATALPLYFPSFTALVGRRALLIDIHLYAGLCLPVPIVVGVLRSRWGKELRKDLRLLNRWSDTDRRWLKTWGRDPFLESGKFNGGQKANAAFVGGSILVMVVTGSIMKWFGPFPLPWRTGATFTHDLLAYAIVFVVTGHICYALRYPATLRAMVTGSVSGEWARRHAPAWATVLEDGKSDTGRAALPADGTDPPAPPEDVSACTKGAL